MFNFSAILSDLQAAIAAVAARERSLTVLLVAVWARIARMGTRLERLVAQWRAGALPKPRAPRVRKPATGTRVVGQVYPRSPGWLRARVWAAGAYGSQLRHMLTDAECAAFLDACPQAGRILRPLFHMLGRDPVPDVVRLVRAPKALVVPRSDHGLDLAAPVVPGITSQFLEA